MFTHVLAAAAATALALTPVPASGAIGSGHPATQTFAITTSSLTTTASALVTTGRGRAGAGCLAQPNAAAVPEDNAPEGTTGAETHIAAVLGGSGITAQAAPVLTTGDCQAEFDAMYDAIDAYELSVAIYAVSFWYPGTNLVAGANWIYRKHAMDVAESRLDRCLAKKK